MNSPGRRSRTRPLTLRDAGKLALALPEVEETTAYDMAAWKAGGRRFAGTPVPRADIEPNTLGIRVAIAERERLLAARPDVYYLTAHYANYPAVLVRLAPLRRAELKAILVMAWQYAMEKGTSRPARGPRRR